MAGAERSITWRSIVPVLLVAALLRALWLVAVPVVPISDSARYDYFAGRLAVGEGYVSGSAPTVHWPIGPSFLFSLCYRITDCESEQRFVPIALMNLLMGVTSTGLTIFLGSRWFSPRTGLLAGWLLALWPSQIQFTSVLASETPMIFFMLAALATWTADRPRPLFRGVLSGVLLAAAAYMRPTALLLPIVIGFTDLLRRPRPLDTLGGVLAMVVTMVALLLPWSLRNQRVCGEFVLISANGGVNLWMGNNPETTGGYTSWPQEWTFASEAERNRQLRDRALAYIRAEPLAFVKRTLIKAARLHERESIGVAWNRAGLERTLASLGPENRDGTILGIKLVANIYWWCVLILAAIGIVRHVLVYGSRGTVFAPPVLLWGYFTAVHAITVIQDRYHFAVIPFIAIIASLTFSIARPPLKTEQRGLPRDERAVTAAANNS